MNAVNHSATIRGRKPVAGNLRVSQAGMTLIEVMVSVSILVVVIGAIFGLATALGDAATTQFAKTNASDEARKGMLYVVRDLRQSADFSISGLPAASITYRMATDLDGNGTAVDVGGNLELDAARTITRDLEDLNGDGFGETQLVRIDGATVQVLANGLAGDEDTNGNGELDTGEDTNNNGVLDRGIWFERIGGSIQIALQTRGRNRQGHELMSNMSTVVVPRN